MLYSTVAALALILNTILNWDALRNVRFRVGNQDKRLVYFRYGHFLLASNFYFLAGFLWGVLYDYRSVPGVFPFLYSDTVFYFIFMLATMLTWARYIVAYLNKNNRRSKLLLHGVWAMFMFGIIYLMVNRFYHFIFSFDNSHNYIPGSGRYVTFVLQIIFYLVTSIYMMQVALRSGGRKKIKYMTVAITSIVICFFTFIQVRFTYYPYYAMGLIVGICLVHTFIEAGEKEEKEIHDHIASTMAEDYEVIYYIDIETGEFLEFAKSQKFKSLNIPVEGKDFFSEVKKMAEEHVYADDREYAAGFYDMETMLKNLEGRRSFSFKYRVISFGEPRFTLFTVMRTSDKKYLIFFVKDIEDELDAEKKQKESQKKTVTFTQIAEGLASNYDDIYYVNIADSSYVSYAVNNIYGQLQVNQSGDDFYAESFSNIPKIVHKQDQEMLKEFMDKDSMLSVLDSHKVCSLEYRLIVSGKTKYVRMTARKTSDGTHFIIGIENIDKEIKREKQHIKALKTEKELARRDELTGIKNKTAYRELEESVQVNMDNGLDYLSYALIVCDANNLKKINDTQGHAAGDEYIKASAKLLCNIFVHSPVFRIGGDEFVVFLRGSDYSSKNELMEKLRGQVLDNQKTGSGPVLASGIAEYDMKNDNFVSDVFDRADKEMYENKQKLKAGNGS